MCAERNAIANMITNGESEIIKLVCIDSKGNVGLPCGACREYLMQLSKSSKNIEILKDIDSKEIVKLDNKYLKDFLKSLNINLKQCAQPKYNN